MKKKVLYGVLMTVLACTSMGTLQSCKDDLDDVKSQFNYDIKTLSGDLSALKTDLENQITINANSIEDLKRRVSALEANSATKEELTAAVNELKSLLATQAALEDALGQIAELQRLLGETNTNVAELASKVTNLEISLTTLQNSYTALEGYYQDLLAKYTTLGDQYTDLLNKYTTVSNQYTQLSTDLTNHIAAFDKHLEDFETYKGEVTTQFEEVYMALEANQEYMTMLYNLINDNYEEFTNRLNGVESDLNDKIDGVNTDLNNKIDGINSDLLSKIDAINTDLQDIWNTLDNHSTLISNLVDEVSDLKDQIDEKMAEVNSRLEDMGLDIEALWQNADRLAAMDNKIIADIAKTNDRIDTFFGFINKQVSGILIQGTYNPLFGDFSLPLGIQSNMLFNWYGQYNGADAMNFPSAAKEYTYNTQAPEVTAEEIAAAMNALGISYETIQAGQYLMNGGFGTLYATVNPVNVNFDKTAFTLETSAGRKLPFDVVLNECDEELTFGYNRSAENGFYRADVSTDNMTQAEMQAAIAATRIELSEEVKTAAKNLYNDRTVRDGLVLLKAIYNSMSGFMPRYAMRYDWTSNFDGETYSNAVLSKYELAVATAKPLSYAFAEGMHSNVKLPHIGSLSNLMSELIGDGFKFDFSNQKLDNITVEYKPLQFNTTLNTDGITQIRITIPEISVWDANGVELGSTHEKTAYVSTESMDDFKSQLQAAFEEAIDSMEGKVNDSIKSMIKDDVEGQLNKLINQVNQMLDDMAGQINEKIENILDKLQDNRLVSAIDKVIDLYNRVAAQLERIMANPNNYLQPTFIYEGARRPHILSTNKKSPTVFKKNGGDAFTIYATSYSAEIVAPAYRKFIACTGVYNLDGSATKDKAMDRVAQINKDNAGKCFGILPGGYKRIVVDASSMIPDYIYEITYQGLDYSGKTSTQKFYLTVKE